jgi:predicted ATP-dependent serine protease
VSCYLIKHRAGDSVDLVDHKNSTAFVCLACNAVQIATAVGLCADFQPYKAVEELQLSARDMQLVRDLVQRQYGAHSWRPLRERPEDMAKLSNDETEVNQ